MRMRVLTTLSIMALAVLGLQAQQPGAPAQPGQPAPGAAAPGAAAETNKIPAEPQPQLKSQKEQEAVVAMFNAAQSGDMQGLIKTGEALIKDHADSEFRPLALEFLTTAYQDMQDLTKMTVYGEMALKAKPDNYRVKLMLAKSIAHNTKEFDLDKDEKVARAEKYVADALVDLKSAPRPNPQITDDQWLEAKKDYEAQGHEVRGITAAAQKNHEQAINNFRSALEMSPNPDPTITLRLGDAYVEAGKPDEAIALMDQVLNHPNMPDSLKGYAENTKKRALQAKGSN